MIYLIGIIIWGLIWGFATRAVISNKGYEENWFWWGFFFGIIAFLVALTKADNKPITTYSYSDRASYTSARPGNNSSATSYSADRTSYIEPIVKTEGTWKCAKCSRYNSSILCQCGMLKGDNDKLVKAQEEARRKEEEEQRKAEEAERLKAEETEKQRDELTKVKALKEYKELLDAGVITQEEFNVKKKDLLGL